MLYSFAELFVYPSLYEGFGLPVVEALRGAGILIPEVAVATVLGPSNPAKTCAG